jgi:hypothetical protein
MSSDNNNCERAGQAEIEAIREEAWQQILAMLDSPETEEREWAARHVPTLFGSPLRAIPILVAMLREPEVREAARNALVLIGGREPQLVGPAVQNVMGELDGVQDQYGYRLVPRILRLINWECQ